MPLTTDSSAVDAYMGSFDRELSSSSQGSSPNRPAAELAKLLKKNKERHPQNIRAVFIFSDGETSNQDQLVDRSHRLRESTGTRSSSTSTAAWSSATAPRRAAR